METKRTITIDAADRRMALRFLGVRNAREAASPAAEDLLRLMEGCEPALLAAIRPAYVYRVFDIERAAGPVVLRGCTLSLPGRAIARHLEGCGRAVLLAATLGGETDRLIREAQLADLGRAMALDALANAAIEQSCDVACRIIGEAFAPLEQTMRFSPGYGDLDLSIQNEFLRVVDAPRRIGLVAGENHMMTPAKSVTAVIGLRAPADG